MQPFQHRQKVEADSRVGANLDPMPKAKDMAGTLLTLAVPRSATGDRPQFGKRLIGTIIRSVSGRLSPECLARLPQPKLTDQMRARSQQSFQMAIWPHTDVQCTVCLVVLLHKRNRVCCKPACCGDD